MKLMLDSVVGSSSELLYSKRNFGAVNGRAVATSASDLRESILVLPETSHVEQPSPVYTPEHMLIYALAVLALVAVWCRMNAHNLRVLRGLDVWGDPLAALLQHKAKGRSTHDAHAGPAQELPVRVAAQNDPRSERV